MQAKKMSKKNLTMKSVLAATACGIGVAVAAPAQATTSDPSNTIWNLGYDAKATTTIKKSGQSATTNGFVFSTYNLKTSDLSSNVMLGDFKMPVMLGKLRVAWATIEQIPTGKAVGSIDPNTHQVTQTQQVNLHVKDISLTGKGLINLVGPNCTTSSPVTMQLSGKMGGLFDPIQLNGTYSIPKFANCGILTDAVNNQVAGDGNTLALTLTPRG